MKGKPISIKKLSWILLLLGIVCFVLYFVANNNIMQLGFRSAEEYDAARDSYLNIMLGGRRFTSGSSIKDLFMDMRESFLYAGILMAVIGLIGIIYFSKHPDKDTGNKIGNGQRANGSKPISVYKQSMDNVSQQKMDKYNTSQLAENNVGANIPVFTRGINNQNEQRTKIDTQEIAQTKLGEQITVVLHTPGVKRTLLLFAIAATVFFTLGIGIFPHSLLSIAAGLCLILFIIKKDHVQSFLAVLPVLLFVSRFFLGESSYQGYDWITVLYRICSYGFLAIIIFMDIGDAFLNFIIIEDDDIVLLSNILSSIGLLNTVLAGIEFFRGFQYGFSIIAFRLGSIVFWISLALYYRYAKKPQVKKSAEVYAGKQPHPYHKICGSLRKLMMGIYVVAAACFIVAPIILTNYLSMLRNTASTGAYGYAVSLLVLRITIISMLILSGLLLIAGLFLIWVNRKIRLRSVAFLLYLEYACGAFILTSIVMIFAYNAWIGIAFTLISVIGSYMLIKWISRSVQIRTYMANEEYLHFSVYYLINKNEPKPQPADETFPGFPVQRIQQDMQLPRKSVNTVSQIATPVPEVYQGPNRSHNISDLNEDKREEVEHATDDNEEWEIEDEADEWEIEETGNPSSHDVSEDEQNEWEIEETGNPSSHDITENEQNEWQIVTDQSNIHKHEELHRIPVRQDICCICGHFLRNGYAVLMKDNTGAEARVDEKCWYAIQTIMGEPNDQGNDSVQYLENQIPYIDPLVGSALAKQLEIYRFRMNSARRINTETSSVVTSNQNVRQPRRRRSES